MSQTDQPASRKRSPDEEFRELLAAGLPPRPFWQRFLVIANHLMRAEGGLLWEVQQDQDRLVPQGMTGPAEMREPFLQRNSGQISHVLQAAATDDMNVISTGDQEGEPFPQRAILTIPYHSETEVVGVLEFVLAKTENGTGWCKRLESLQKMIGVAEQSFGDADSGNPVDTTQFWTEFEDFSYQLHRSLTLSHVLDVVVNDGRQMLQCDRLSVALVRGKSVKVKAVSGSEKVNWRSREVQSLGDLAREAITINEPLEFRGDDREFAPHVANLLAHHVELTGIRFLNVVPLFAPAERKPDADKDFKSEPIRTAVGCLLIEQFHEGKLSEKREEHIPVLADHVGASIANALSQERVFLLPTRRVLGKGLDFFRGRFLAKTLLVLGLVLTMILCLALIPWEYRVEAEGRLMPTTQQHLFAPWDGVIVSVAVGHGESIQAGDPLLTIHNDVLHAERNGQQNDLLEKQQQLLSLQAEVNSAIRQADRKTEIQLKGQLEETRLEIIGLKEQLAILVDREESLTLRSPIDGVVATFQIQEKLLNRPVSRGEKLLEVMDESGEWRLELELPEHRMGHLLRAMKKKETAELPVEYVLATDVETSFSGTVIEPGIATRSEVNQESGTVVQIFVNTDKQQLQFLRIGAEATGKISCGQRSLGYVLLGDVWEFVLRYVWL